MPDPRIIREKYCITAPSYDELYREEQVAKYSLVFSYITPSGILADIGAGTCLLEEYMLEEGMLREVSYLVALDLTDCMLSLCKKRVIEHRLYHLVDIVVAEATRLPIRDKSIDYTFAFTVYDLTPDLDRAVEEMVRVTRRLGFYTLLKRAERRRLSSGCQVYLGETDKDVICLPRALHKDKLKTSIFKKDG